MVMKKSDKIFLKKLKQIFKIEEQIINKFYYIFKQSEQLSILNEFSYFRALYEGIPPNVLFETVLNKYLKIKFYNLKFQNISKDVNEYKRALDIYHRCNVLGIEIPELDE